MEKLLKLLAGIRPDVNFADEKKLVSNGILDSFDIVAVVSEINDAFDIRIPPLMITPEHFNSAKTLYALITRLSD